MTAMIAIGCLVFVLGIFGGWVMRTWEDINMEK